MPTWLKVLLIIFLAGLLLAATAIFLGIRWLKSHEAELSDLGRNAEAQARDWGKGKDANACVDEALRRTMACGDLEVMCQVRASVFFDGCMQVASVPADFCANVPGQLEIMATVKWQMAQCAQRGHPNDRRCSRFFTNLQKRCERR